MSRWRTWWWRAPHLVWLTVLWVLLWGDVDAPVVLAGFAVALVTLAAWRRRGPLTHTVRPAAAVRFAAAVAADMVRANLTLTLEVLTPTDRTAPGLVDVTLPNADPAVVSATTQAINLAPGTVVVDQPQPDVLRVHALYCDHPDRVAARIEHLARLADAALVAHQLDPAPDPSQ